MNVMRDFARAVKKKTNGEVRFRIYPGGVHGDEKDVVRKIRIGQLHAAALSTTGLISVTPDIEGLSFPLDVRTDEEMEALRSILAAAGRPGCSSTACRGDRTGFCGVLDRSQAHGGTTSFGIHGFGATNC